MYSLVQGLDKFDGSSNAWTLLSTNGFVVADPSFKNMFDPYVDDALPYFITSDTAWHAYHTLLDQGMAQLQRAQSPKLADFSRALWTAASDSSLSASAEISAVKRYAAIGLALQDKSFRISLPDDQKKIVDALLSENGPVAVEFGPPLWAPDFHPTDTNAPPDWMGYHAAWQWYSRVQFRNSAPAETRVAASLAWLVNSQSELQEALRQLSDPWVALVPQPACAPFYAWANAEKSASGSDTSLAAAVKNSGAAQKQIAKSFPDGIGVILFPSQNPVAALNSRRRPAGPQSGLSYLSANPALRSPALDKAAKMDGIDVVLDSGAASPSAAAGTLHERALALFKSLQSPLPVRVGPALRSEAWSEKQVWTQLGAWAESEHAPSPRTAGKVDDSEPDRSLPGVVEPYPEFFTGLGKIAGEAGAVFEKAGVDQAFDARATARKLLDCVTWQQSPASRSPEEMERMASSLLQLNEFISARQKGSQDDDTGKDEAKALSDLEALARRCAQAAPSDEDRAVLMDFYNARQTVPKMLRDLGPFCDRLAELAKKYLDGVEYSEDDKTWIGGYGVKLAQFEFSSGGAATVLDTAPVVNRMNPGAAGAGYYTGVGRPQALYIILPAEGKLRLYRGAVLSYREFARTNEAALDDSMWRGIASTGNVPPPPAFVRSFFAERDISELLKSFMSFNADGEGYKEAGEAIEQLQSRVTDRDVPALIAALSHAGENQWEPVSDGLAQAIGKLHWQPYQRDLMALLETNDDSRINFVAPIMLQHPDGLDTKLICESFTNAPPRARRIYCGLLSHQPQTDLTRATLARALADESATVRYGAASVIDTSMGGSAVFTEALIAGLSDTNQYVAGAMASALGRIKATNAAAAMLTNLDAWMKVPAPSFAELRKQSDVIRDLPLNMVNAQPEGNRFGGRAVEPRFNFQRLARMRNGAAIRVEEPPAASGIIEALGDMRYLPVEDQFFTLLTQPSYATAAAKALKQMSPEKLARQLVNQARDKKNEVGARDQALQLLGTPPVAGSPADLAPLLDDTTVVPMVAGRRLPAGRDWRICDRAAETISSLLGRPIKLQPMQPADQRDLQIEQIRQAMRAGF